MNTTKIDNSNSDVSGNEGINEIVLLQLQPAQVAKWLTQIVLVLVATGTAANYLIYNVASHPDDKLARLMRRFDLGHEPSIPALYSSLTLMGCAILLAVIGLEMRRRHDRHAIHWLVLAVIFVALSIDECVMIHEMIDNLVAQFIERSGLFYFVWVIPGMIFALSVGVLSIGFLRHLNARTRWLFISAGALFVFGAIGMEMVAGVIAQSSGLESIQHTISQTIEESCEMLGIVLFIYAQLDFIAREFGRIMIQTTRS